MATKNHMRTTVTGKPVKRMDKTQMRHSKGGLLVVIAAPVANKCSPSL